MNDDATDAELEDDDLPDLSLYASAWGLVGEDHLLRCIAYKSRRRVICPVRFIACGLEVRRSYSSSDGLSCGSSIHRLGVYGSRR